MALAIMTKCSKNLEAMSSYACSPQASSSAIDSIVAQKKAIQAVPSACSMYWPLGSGLERSNRPMLSMPRKPPEKTFLPAGSWRLTHQVKSSSSFWNALARNARSRLPGGAVILYTRQQAHACTGGFTSEKLNS